MARRSNETATFFAQKKLLGKAHTSNLLTDAGEVISTNVQLASTTVFGEAIPTNPSKSLNIGQGVGSGAKTVEYVEFALEPLDDSIYDANATGGGSGAESGESGQTSGHHAYAFKFKSTYQSDTDNSRGQAGNGNFNNSKKLFETLGAAQLVPFNFSGETNNPYVVQLYKDNGSGQAGDEIVLLANIDWQVDTYNGILFVQDYDANQVPAFARAFVYIGDMLDTVVSSGGGGGGSGDNSAQYLVLSSTGSLANERVFTAGTGLKTTDAGANGNFTVGIKDSIVATISGSTFTGDFALHKASPVFNIQRTNNNQNSDIAFKGTGGQIGARLRFSGSQVNDLVFSTYTGTTLKERMRIRSNLPDIAVEVTGAIKSTLGFSGSLTQLTDGTSYLVAGTGTTISSASNGQVTISSSNTNGNYVFNEYVGQGDGVNTLFTLDNTPTSNKNISIYLNGLLQMPAKDITGAPFQDYSVTGSAIYFMTSSVPHEGSIIMANYTTNDAI